jgi:hypothetical protein
MKEIMAIYTPQITLESIDWLNYQGLAASFDDGDPSWEIAVALASASVLSGLSGISLAYTQHAAGWNHERREADFITSLDTAINGSTAHTTSLQFAWVYSMFNDLRATGPSFARKSIGWTGRINITIAFLTTTCTPNSTQQNYTVDNPTPPPTTSMPATLTLDIGGVPPQNFTGATCTLTFPQGLFPVTPWDVALASMDASLDGYTSGKHNTPVLFAPSTTDAAIVANLALQI